MERVCVFIDGSNFYHALREQSLPVSVDFSKFAKALVGEDRNFIHLYYYNTPLIRPQASDPSFANLDALCRNQQRFFNALRFVPNLTFRQGRFQKLPDGKLIEKGVDVALATDMLVLAMKDRYDTAILVSSDADYKHAIELIKFEAGKRVELHQVAGSKEYDLITICDEYRPITSETINSCLHEKYSK